jgi:hypothetical protein
MIYIFEAQQVTRVQGSNASCTQGATILSIFTRNAGNGKSAHCPAGSLTNG